MKAFTGDAAAWAFNVASSVAIVFCNKVLMDPKWGYKFVFGGSMGWWACRMACMRPLLSPSLPETPVIAATTLCSLHFFASAIAVKSFEVLGLSDRATLPLKGK